MAGIWARPHHQEGKDRNRRCPQGCGRLGGLRHHPVRAGDSHEQGLGPSRHQSRISFLQEVESRFVVLPITGRVCARIGLPPSYPKDPADRIIGATALVEGLSLLPAVSQFNVDSCVMRGSLLGYVQNGAVVDQAI